MKKFSLKYEYEIKIQFNLISLVFILHTMQ